MNRALGYDPSYDTDTREQVPEEDQARAEAAMSRVASAHGSAGYTGPFAENGHTYVTLGLAEYERLAKSASELHQLRRILGGR